MAVETRWFIIHTYSGYENKVTENIRKIIVNRKMQDRIFDVCIPREKVSELKTVSVKTLTTMLKNKTIDQDKFDELSGEIIESSPKVAFVLALSKAEEARDTGAMTPAAFEAEKGRLIGEYPEIAASMGISLDSDKGLEKKFVTEAMNTKKELCIEVERLIFPSYVMVKLAVEYSTKKEEANVLKVPDEVWHAIRYTSGVTGFVGPDGKPTPLTPDEIKRFGIEDDVAVKTDSTIVNLGYKVGDFVVITTGRLEGYSGVVEKIDEAAGVVRVIISQLGREIPAELPLTQVKLAID